MTAPTNPIPVAKIAYLTGEYPRATDTFIQREVAGLRAAGVHVLTCSIRKTGPEHLSGEEQAAAAASTFYVQAAALAPLHLLACHLRAILHAPKRYFTGLALAWQMRAPGAKSALYQLFYFAEAVVLADYMRRNQITHLHNHIATASGTVALLASEISAIPYSFTLHGPDIFFEPIRWRLDLKIARARFVACISHFCRSQAMVFSPPKEWGKLHIVHCGVEPLRYRAATDPSVGDQLLFVGRLAAVKGIPVLFEALKNLKSEFPQLKLTLIGDGPERAALEGLAQRMGLMDHLNFAGYRSQTEVATALAQTDILVLPSFAEGLPVVLMEALAAAKPVVVSNIAGVNELVKDGVNGALVAPGNAPELHQRLRELLKDPELRRKFGMAGRAVVAAEFDSKAEAAWLAHLLSAYQNDETRPGLRPNVPVAS